MTLLEVAVALLITSAILAAGYAAMSGTLDVTEQHAIEVPRWQRAAALRSTLVALLSSAFATPDDDDPGFALVPSGIAASRLVFPVASVPWLSRERGIAELYVDGDDATPERGLVLSFRESDGRTVIRELSPWVDRIGARVLVEEPGGPAWLEAWASSVQLPLAVELQISVRDSIAAAATLLLLIPLATR